MQYNTQKTTIEITEYGRNIQQLLLRANDIAAPDERLAYVEKVLDAMYAINPQVRITEDYRSKLWSHAFRITNYTLDVEPPFGITLDAQEDFFHKRPQRIGYPQNIVKFRHYGKNISTLIAKAIATEDAEKREEFTQFIASFMKMAQINYNREGVSDEVIRRDLHDLSNGKLSLDSATDIQDIARGNRVVLDEKPKTRRGKRGGKNKKQATTSVATSANTQNSNNNSNNRNANNTKNENRNEPKQTRSDNQKAQQQQQRTKQAVQNNVKTTENAPKQQQQPKQNEQTPNTVQPKQQAKQQPKPRIQQVKQQVKPQTKQEPSNESAVNPQRTNNEQTPEGATKKRRRGGRGRGGKGKKAE